MAFPIDKRNEREFDPGWAGEVFVCDIDRTYLYTRFSSMSGISRIPFEFAVDKQDIAGMSKLLREVRRGPERISRNTPLYFVSASPAQLRRVIQRKMLLDGLEFDGTIFKDWLGVLSGLRPRRFKEQLGFKVTALLLLRQDLPAGAREVLIGDDLETDALAFALYADILAGRLSGEHLLKILLRHGVAQDDAQGILALAREVNGGEVKRIYLRLERHVESPETFIDYWPRVVICLGAFQMALSLWSEGSISEDGVARVAADLVARGQESSELDQRLHDCCRRSILSQDQGAAIRGALAGPGLISPQGDLPRPDPLWQEASQRDPGDPWTPKKILQG